MKAGTSCAGSVVAGAGPVNRWAGIGPGAGRRDRRDALNHVRPGACLLGPEQGLVCRGGPVTVLDVAAGNRMQMDRRG